MIRFGCYIICTYIHSLTINIAMGILYTITSYLYPHNPTPINEHAIRTKSQRLIFKIKNIQYKLQQETFK